jgi:hypothetical protein
MPPRRSRSGRVSTLSCCRTEAVYEFGSRICNAGRYGASNRHSLQPLPTPLSSHASELRLLAAFLRSALLSRQAFIQVDYGYESLGAIPSFLVRPPTQLAIPSHLTRPVHVPPAFESPSAVGKELPIREPCEKVRYRGLKKNASV